MARKPLIEAGSILPPQAPESGDVMSRIIARDREKRSGSNEEEFVNELTNQQANELTNQQDNQLASTPSNDALLANHLSNQPANELTNQQDSLLINKRPLDPIRDAILMRLAMPYDDLSKEAAILVAARVPRELSERFDLVAQVQKRNKQDVLADALRLYIAHVVAEDTIK